MAELSSYRNPWVEESVTHLPGAGIWLPSNGVFGALDPLAVLTEILKYAVKNDAASHKHMLKSELACQTDACEGGSI